MHSIIKSSFYIIFLFISFIAGSNMALRSKGSKGVQIFGFMVLFLGIGESFHLIPRIIDIFNHDLKSIESLINTGRLISSLTIVVVYLMLMWFSKLYYTQSISKKINIGFLCLGVTSLILSIVFMNSNQILIVLLRNIPIILIGILVVVQFKRLAYAVENNAFKYLWLAILLALVFTISFELLSDSVPFLIILMMPKTLMNIWIVLMGYIAYRKNTFELPKQ